MIYKDIIKDLEDIIGSPIVKVTVVTNRKATTGWINYLLRRLP